MDEAQEKNHYYESNTGGGVLVYIIDNNTPEYVKFHGFVRIEVLFNSGEQRSAVQDSEFENNHDDSVAVKSQIGKSVVACRNDPLSVSVACEPKGADVNDIQAGQVEIDGSEITKENSECRGRKCRKSASRKSESSGVLKSSRLSRKVKGNTTTQLRLEADSKPKVENNEEHVINDGFEENENKNMNDAVESGQFENVYSKRLRSSNSIVKLKLRIPVKASKTATNLMRTTLMKNTKSKKFVAKHSEDPDIKVENGEKLQLLVKDRPRKLLMDKTVKCKYCTVEFKNQQEFYDHRRAEESVHKCGICGKVEPYEAHLIVHMQKHRRVKEDVRDKATGISNNSEDGDPIAKKKSKKEKMKCNICELVVSSMDSLKIHTFLHTGEYAYRCCVCGEQFSSLSSRQHHMDVHVSAHRFKCNPCGERFTSRAELSKHQLTHEIKCALCGEIFPNKTSRTCHFRVSHSEDILKCTLCTNLFATMEDLEKHLTYHKKGKKEQCPVCGLVVSKLKDHMMMHSQVAQEKLYACDQCPMRYLRKSNLDRHMRTHTGEKPYACNRCPKSFRGNGMLRKHLLTHTKERPYQCEVCGKQCSLRSNLNIHMRVHNSDRHFSCLLCSQTFNHKNSLHGHMKNKHTQELIMHDGNFTPANPPHEPQLLPPSIFPEMNRNVSFSEKSVHNLTTQLEKPAGLDCDFLREKMENHQSYSQMLLPMAFPGNMPGSMNAHLHVDDRAALNKYEIQLQSNASLGYQHQLL